jgi:membrane fusion protein (multidrug efflux system)
MIMYRPIIKIIFCFTLPFTFFSCSREETSQKAQNDIVSVSFITVEPKDVPVTFEFIAQTQSSHLVNIQARVDGFLDRRVYKEGEIVQQGQTLFLMDPKPFQTQVDAAQAALDQQKAASETARSNLVRIKPLVELKALSQKDLDDANGTYLTSSASVEQAKAQLETALLNLSYCTITSPITGVTSSAIKQDGSYINVLDSQLTTVSAISPIWVNFSVSENQLQNVNTQVAKKHLVPPKNGQYEVRVLLVDNTLFPYTGSITFAEPYYNAQTGTFLIRSTFDNPEGTLKPNQYVRARLEGGIRPNAILVPQQAVQQSAKGNFVWVINKENKADFRPVTVGDWHGDDWFITEGLWPGEQVIVEGVLKIRPGQPVQAMPYVSTKSSSIIGK